MPMEGSIIGRVGLTSRIEKEGEPKENNFFFPKIAYILANINFYLQLIHK